MRTFGPANGRGAVCSAAARGMQGGSERASERAGKQEPRQTGRRPCCATYVAEQHRRGRCLPCGSLTVVSAGVKAKTCAVLLTSFPLHKQGVNTRDMAERSGPLDRPYDVGGIGHCLLNKNHRIATFQRKVRVAETLKVLASGIYLPNQARICCYKAVVLEPRPWLVCSL
jgi:hypothetical protein